MNNQMIPVLMKAVMKTFEFVEEDIKKNYVDNPQAAAKARDNAAKLQQEIMNKVTNGEISDIQELRYALKSIMDRKLKRYPSKIPEHGLGITQSWEGGMPKVMFDLPIYVKGGYRIAPDGVFKKADAKDMDYREQLCSHAFIPIQRLVSLQKKPESYQVIFNRDGKWKDFVITANEMLSSSGLQKYASKGVIISEDQARAMVKFCRKFLEADIIKWNTVVLVTGEQPMTTIGTSQGAKNRIIEVELEYLDADFYSIDKTLRHNYGLIGPLIIEKLKAMKDVDDELKARADRLLAARSNVSGKMVNYGAACLLAYDILQEIFGEGSLTDRGVAGYLKSKGDINNTDDAYKHIIGWVTTMSKNFEWGSGYEPPAGVTRPSDWSSYHEIYGTMHDGYVTIKRDELNKELMATFSRDMKTFQRDMAARDYIRVQRDKQGKVTAYFNTQSVNGERLDCFRVNMNVEIPKEENGNA